MSRFHSGEESARIVANANIRTFNEARIPIECVGLGDETASLEELRWLARRIHEQTGRHTSVEFPGHIVVGIPNRDDWFWCVGTANTDWGADVNGIDGSTLDGFTLEGSRDWTIERVAARIMERIVEIESARLETWTPLS